MSEQPASPSPPPNANSNANAAAKPALPAITREVSGSRGRYVMRMADGSGAPAEAELTYSIASAQLIIADHTGVPDAFRGTGAGRALVERLVADARAEGVKIVPLCPFVNGQRQRHPEWADVFQT